MIKKIKNLDEKIFLTMYNYSKKNKKLYDFFNVFTKISKNLFVVIYVSVVLYTYMYNYNRLAFVILIPFFGLVTSVTLRKIVNRNRPYIVFSKLQLPVKKIGSFPSNHSVSSFLISFTCLHINIMFGIIIFIIAIISSISRVFVGIHFPADIISGLLIAIFFGSLFFIL